jgi:hypothetical protein
MPSYKKKRPPGASRIDALRARGSRVRLACSPPRPKAYPLLTRLHRGHVALSDLHGILVLALGAEFYNLGVFFKER